MLPLSPNSRMSTNLLLQQMDTKLNEYINKFDLVLAWIVEKFGNDDLFPDNIRNLVLGPLAQGYLESSQEAGGEAIAVKFEVLEDAIEPSISNFDFNFSEGTDNTQDADSNSLIENNNDSNDNETTNNSSPICLNCHKPYDPLSTTHKCEKNDLLVRHNCTQCDKTYHGRTALRLHINTHHRGQRFECLRCGKGFVQRGTLRRHMKTVHKEEQPTLPLTSTTSTLPNQNSENTISSNKCALLNCRLCTLTFQTKFQLQWHIKLVHYPKKQKQATNETGVKKAKRQFSKKHNSKSQPSNDDYLKPYICEILTCPRRFKHQSELKRHAQIHSNEKTHVCEICGQAFTMLCSLSRHLKKVHEPVIIVPKSNENQ